MSKQQIILTRKGRGTEPGEKVSVDEARAQELVDNGLAKYPPKSKAAEKSAS